MYNECRHILPSGHKCRAAALRGRAFCYYHTASRRLIRTTTTSPEAVLLPPIEDVAGVQAAVNQVLRSYSSRRINRQEASTFFYGLQIASMLALRTRTEQKPGDTVRELCEDVVEGVIAPESSACDAPKECYECPERDDCEECPLWQDPMERRRRYQRLAFGDPDAEAKKAEIPENDAEPAAPEPETSATKTVAPPVPEPDFPGCDGIPRDPVREYFRGTGIEPPPQLISPRPQD